MRPPVYICKKCGVRLIPYTYSYIFDYVNRKAIRVCKRCHDEHVRRKSKNARTHGNE
nr:MAG TPA: TFIIB Transcription factor zinc-finger [Caudoviricetes sp.]